MSKIFRLYKEGTDTYENWNNSPSFPYNSTSRDTIEDPDGASASHEITSIPSPFARIDLVKNAFKEVCKKDKKSGKVDLDGQTIFHKMVSDTLDVAEIFFNIDKYQDKIEIIKWDRNAMLSELENSPSAGHQYLADALDKYFKSDASTYNFEDFQSLYLLNYLHGPDQINIIGATSPSTLFFSNANDLNYVTDIYFGEDLPFDSEYQPLYKRDFEFIKYLFSLRASISNFATLFPEVDGYLDETRKKITDPAKKTELNNVSVETLGDFEPIIVKDSQQNNYVEVIGNQLYKKSGKPKIEKCEFIINSKESLAQPPMVLPIEAGNRYSKLQYTTAQWGNTNKAPIMDEEHDLEQRRLPFDGAVYPYLTISDFLEDSLIKVPHKLNSDHYFDGHIKVSDSELSYLIPLKPTFFDYFTVEDLFGNMVDNRPMFEMTLLAGNSVSVTLRIPIKGSGNVNYVEYTRIYYNNSSSNIEANAGNIVEMKFTGFVMPPVKFINPADAIYNISCVQPTQGKVEFSFFNASKRIDKTPYTCRYQNDDFSYKAFNYLLKKNNFDFIRVSNPMGYNGLIIPKFIQQQSIRNFEFAIDLGTSNTHIEYRVADEKPKVFTFDESDQQLCNIFVQYKNEFGYLTDLENETELIERDYLPSQIGEGDYHFPTRTVLSSATSVDWDKDVEPFSLANIPFTYEKRANLPYNKIHYDIKWGQGNEQRVMETYVRNLMLILRNKVLMNKGNLVKTKITWFYPISMAPKRRRKLEATWNNAYKEYFGGDRTVCMTESFAPIQFFFNRYSTVTNLINVDIGGGTTDIAFAKDRTIDYVTSFRFASNSLFEDSFAEYDITNGIVDYHKNAILHLLEEQEIRELVQVFNSMADERPSNMASFLFGLKDNSLPKNKQINEKAIDFNYMLQEDENFKIVFILFYSSIIYHIAQITKVLNLDVPRHISFSGNGSKVIRVLTTDPKLLAKYTKLIFEKVLDRPYGKELELIGLEGNSNPKESTCKGGLIGNANEDKESEQIVLESGDSEIVAKSKTYADVTEADKTKAVEAVTDFFNLIFNVIGKEFDFDNNFGVTPRSLAIAQDMSKKDLATYLEKGIKQRKSDTDDSATIEETFFYYPIKGVLQTISSEIHKSLKNQ